MQTTIPTALTKSLFAAALAWGLCVQATSAGVIEWQFPTGVNPSSPQVGDPAALATVTVGQFGSGYKQNNAGYAAPGVPVYWDLGQSGNVVLSVPSLSGDLDLTLLVRQYWDGGIYKGSLNYAVDNGSLQSSPPKVWFADTATLGSWYDYTTVWHVSPSLNPETITIFGAANGTLVSDIQLTVVPEPPAGVACAAVMAVAAALFEWRRRRAAIG